MDSSFGAATVCCGDDHQIAAHKAAMVAIVNHPPPPGTSPAAVDQAIPCFLSFFLLSSIPFLGAVVQILWEMRV
jgi:hypothetical protein